MPELFNTTNISLAIIGILFIVFFLIALKMLFLYKLIKKAKNSDDTLSALKGTKLASLAKSYTEAICIDVDEKKKTNTPALEIFSEFSTCSAYKINLKFLDAAAGIVVGLGLLGTFLGLTLGINGFDSTSTQNIQNSIQVLLSGMGTAFRTSLVGMTASIIYIFIPIPCEGN